MPFQLPNARRLAVPAPEPTSVEPDALTEEEQRLLDDPAFVADYIAWRERQR
ncbi:hypothetical protein [Microbacterium binotii]|uniref:Uncharacterized protein n=1 Tax=Microbacterium binotii TaxID=462710 RepID=A0ABN3P6K0_9MICO